MRRLLVGVALLVGGCGPAPPPEPQPGCNPLIGDDCRTPFPSSFYETPDPATATGVRVAIPDGMIAIDGAPRWSSARLVTRDGASPSSPFIVYLADGVEPTQLPTADTLERSLRADSPVQVIDMATLRRVPVMAELDANAAPGARRALLVRPMVRLDAGARYAIALVALRGANGAVLAPAPFRALRDGDPVGPALAALAPRTQEVLAALEAAGVPRASLTLAWDVHTASDADLTRHLMAMRDEALAAADGLGYTIDERLDESAATSPDRLRRLRGTFEVPSYLEGDGPTAAMRLDAAGAPVRVGTARASFEIDVPRCAEAASAPLPILVYGHGLASSARAELDSAYGRYLGNELCMLAIGTDWIGLSSGDLPPISSAVAADLNALTLVTDRLQQAHVNAQVLTRLVATRLKDDPALLVNGRPVSDGAEVYYLGISNGGIQGPAFLALSDRVARGVLNVAGSEWSLLMFRSTAFGVLRPVLDVLVPDPLDQQLAVALTQPEWDHTDPATFAPHLVADPLASATAKRVLLQEGIGDAQVANLGTRVLARTIDLPGLDLVEPVFGVAERAPPLDSAYTQWDVSALPRPPATDTALDADNGTHEAIAHLPAVIRQVKAFLRPDGQVTDQCGMKPCVFPGIPTGF